MSNNDVTGASGRRRGSRHPVCVPAEVRVFDERGLHAISEPSHAVVCNLSPGGMQLEVLGRVTELLEHNVARQKLEVILLPPEFRRQGHLICAIRWSRPSPGSDRWAVGVQLPEAPDGVAEKIYEGIKRCETRTGFAKSWTWTGLAAVAAIVAMVAMVAFQWGAKRQRRVRFPLHEQNRRLTMQLDATQVAATQLARAIEESEQELDTVRAAQQSCAGQLVAAATATIPVTEVPAANSDERSLWVVRVATEMQIGDGVSGAAESPQVHGLRVRDGKLTGVVHLPEEADLPQFAVRLEGGDAEAVICEPSPLQVEQGKGEFRCALPASDAAQPVTLRLAWGGGEE